MPAFRVLFVEDSDSDVNLARVCLQRSGVDPEIRVVDDEPSLIRALRDWRPELLVSDLSLPRFSGMEAFDIAQRYAPDVPFLFRSGGAPSRSIQHAIEQGAIGHVEKNQDHELVRIVLAIIDSTQQISRSGDF